MAVTISTRYIQPTDRNGSFIAVVGPQGEKRVPYSYGASDVHLAAAQEVYPDLELVPLRTTRFGNAYTAKEKS